MKMPTFWGGIWTFDYFCASKKGIAISYHLNSLVKLDIFVIKTLSASPPGTGVKIQATK